MSRSISATVRAVAPRCAWLKVLAARACRAAVAGCAEQVRAASAASGVGNPARGAAGDGIGTRLGEVESCADRAGPDSRRPPPRSGSGRQTAAAYRPSAPDPPAHSRQPFRPCCRPARPASSGLGRRPFASPAAGQAALGNQFGDLGKTLRVTRHQDQQQSRESQRGESVEDQRFLAFAGTRSEPERAVAERLSPRRSPVAACRLPA
jgi:hypothetical protein